MTLPNKEIIYSNKSLNLREHIWFQAVRHTSGDNFDYAALRKLVVARTNLSWLEAGLLTDDEVLPVYYSIVQGMSLALKLSQLSQQFEQ